MRATADTAATNGACDPEHRKARRPTVVSLFSGCGGSDAGLVAAGFDVVFANDKAAYARELYLANLPETDFQCKDIGEIRSFPRADLLVGCYPCQGFSQGGARVSDRKINYLYREFDRALRQIKPRAFVVENVSGMRRSDFAHLLRNQITRFRMAGYRVQHQLLDAAHFGVPQRRARIFIVGVRSDIDALYVFPRPTHGVDGKERVMTVADALTGLPKWPKGEFCADKFHWYYMSRNRRCEWSEPSKTIVSHPRHMPLHPMSPKLIRVHVDKWIWPRGNARKRRFSYREAARLQGFGRNMTFPETGSLTEKYRAVGNAVPPPLFEAIGRAFGDIW